jgi:hypothetical protein
VRHAKLPNVALLRSHELAGPRIPTAIYKVIVFYVFRVHKRSAHSDMWKSIRSQ